MGCTTHVSSNITSGMVCFFFPRTCDGYAVREMIGHSHVGSACTFCKYRRGALKTSENRFLAVFSDAFHFTARLQRGVLLMFK